MSRTLTLTQSHPALCTGSHRTVGVEKKCHHHRNRNINRVVETVQQDVIDLNTLLNNSNESNNGQDTQAVPVFPFLRLPSAQFEDAKSIQRHHVCVPTPHHVSAIPDFEPSKELVKLEPDEVPHAPRLTVPFDTLVPETILAILPANRVRDDGHDLEHAFAKSKKRIADHDLCPHLQFVKKDRTKNEKRWEEGRKSIQELYWHELPSNHELDGVVQ
mmetsp:Transcript_76721/g.151793  ORF Transcript_76721/g.151793 Transcript_76721/m.151793 type:complete len:216 (+) Transcript_76721:1358-2005(+)